MPAEFDVYVRRNTWMYALDPRVKLAFVVVAVTLTFLRPWVWGAVAVSGVCLVLLWLAPVPTVRVWRFIRGLAPFLLMVFGLTALFTGGPSTVWLRLGPLRITAGAAAQGVLLAARLLALGLAFFIWLSTTDQAGMVRGFMALRIPYAWGLTLALALRYLPILAGLFDQVREAQAARGLDLAQGGFRQRLRAYRPVLIAVVIGALRHGERLGWALEARALGGPGVPRSVYRPLRLRGVDKAALAVLIGVLGAGILGCLLQL